ncbi:MAG: hypothetical protein ABSA72_09765 [Nitrososphaerales archaeon]
MLTRRRRRSGVSSIIGAVFFILVVFLVFSATVLVFESFSNYSLIFKQVDQQDAQNRVTNAGIASLDFGGLAPNTTKPITLTAVANTASPTRSLFPITNMNFSSSMSGWVFSRDYKIVRDDGYVTNTYLDIIPGGTVFTLAVTNADPAGSCAGVPVTSCITRVSLQVDSRFSLAGLPLPSAPPGWTAQPISGNTITWTAPVANGISPASNPVLFNWTALAPGVPGAYFQTATLTWLTVFHTVPIVDQGSVTVQTNVVTGGPGGVSIPTLCAPPAPAQSNICAEPAGVIPGGAVGGYDPISNVVGSESGPGSFYLNFQPTYNGTTITSGQQLTAVMNITSAFTIDAGQAAALATVGNVDAVNFGFSLDQLVAPPEPLVLINQYLIQLTPTGGVNDIIQVPNLTPVVPSQVNDFNSSGWITCGPSSVNCNEPYFNPVTLATAQSQPAWVWTPGLYELVISVEASMPGATPPSANYPSSLLMHFDDIGLNLRTKATAYFADNTVAASCPLLAPTCYLQIPFAVSPSQVQSIQLTTSLSLGVSSSENVTAYVYAGDVSRGTATPVWVELGQIELSSSATITVNIPSSSASNFIDTAGTKCGVIGICVRVYAVSDGVVNFQALTISESAVVQTYQQNTVTVTLLNNSTFPVAFTTLYVSGPDGATSYQIVPNANPPYYCGEQPLSSSSLIKPCYVNQGQVLIVQLPFLWKTDQTYVATVVTNKGLSFSETFVSP